MALAKKFSVNLDAELQEALSAYAAGMGMTPSQAVRVLLAQALRESTESSQGAFRAAAYREGALLAVGRMRAHFNQAMHSLMERTMADIDAPAALPRLGEDDSGEA